VVGKSNKILKEFGFSLAIRMEERGKSDKIMGRRDRKKGDTASENVRIPPPLSRVVQVTIRNLQEIHQNTFLVASLH